MIKRNITRTLLFALVAATASAGCKTVQKATGGVKIVGDHVELDDHVRFDSGKDTILADSHGLLDRVAFVLKARDDIAKVHVNGHTDKTGDADQNQALSEARAKSVVAYLSGKGVASSMEAMGFGQTQPLCEEATSDCNAKNRRVEFLIEWK